MYTCRKCNTVLTVGINWYSKGLQYKNFICNECRKEYYHQNKTKINAQSKAWREKNKEYLREYGKQHRALNKDKYKDQNLRWHYNLSLSEYNDMLKAQDYCCAICNTKTPKGQGSFHVDHDHTSGKIRGLLCQHCNTALGKFKDSIEVLNKAISYLGKYK